ncbi:hypothetical protein KKC32_03430 [Patescibacteria group bacterium]|nr:hypothetical protein [Patescibacteria group bacterium]
MPGQKFCPECEILMPREDRVKHCWKCGGPLADFDAQADDTKEDLRTMPLTTAQIEAALKKEQCDDSSSHHRGRETFIRRPPAHSRPLPKKNDESKTK